MAAFDYDANLIQGASKGTSPVAYATWTPYVGYSSTLPNKNGTNITECADGTYGRILVGNGSPSAGAYANAGVLTGPSFTGAYTIHYLVIFDAPTGGNARRFGTTDLALAVAAGDAPTFAIGALTDAMS